MATLLGVLAQTGPHGPMGSGAGGGMAGGGWAGGTMGGGLFPWLGPWGGLIGLLVVVLLLGAVVYALGTLATREGGDEGGGDDALEILERRYARGELDEEEYEVRRQWLRGE
ncbi:SHOCT domain-containing protein [Halobaculum rubrum]|uniref:SHOCT domain-containing protein n=1 Tax=Halobaculum rubrum TaxID=2872158 RepID=UPI001CA423FE|nr:SHOCT domain-containing protein [Halobaculum rubrum]QZY00472.1 SHOCT domain-containing protein [Halobaculum rubrum]